MSISKYSELHIKSLVNKTLFIVDVDTHIDETPEDIFEALSSLDRCMSREDILDS